MLNEKIARLERFIIENRALADVPFMIVAGRAITPREALTFLREGRYTTEIMEGLARLGLDPEAEEVWQLAEEFYRRLVAVAPERPRIYMIGYVPAMSPAEALEHVRARDDVGRIIVQSYVGMLRFMRERVDL